MSNKIFISEQNLIDFTKYLLGKHSMLCGKEQTVYDFLNMQFFTKELRTLASKDYLVALNKLQTSPQKQNAQAFCTFEILSDVHLNLDNVDYTQIQGLFTILLPSAKLGLLEELLVRTNLALIGKSEIIKVERTDKGGNVIKTESRNANIMLSRPSVSEVIAQSELGQIAIVTFNASYVIYDKLLTYKDYILYLAKVGNPYHEVDYTFFKISYDTVPKALSNTNLQTSGMLNNTSAVTFNFGIYDSASALGQLLEDIRFNHQVSLAEGYTDGETKPDTPSNINTAYYLKLVSPNKITYVYKVICLNASQELTNNITQATISNYTFKVIAKI